ncbi:MAG: hypothetical protein GC190_19175 [Alphaproteobacteria bacterium]|nr:hypothetical protein [Alphaproteobacteria bacterium]
MSIRLMTRVWDSGQYSAGTLVVLLALADWADDDGGRLFPKLETLEKKTRLSVKQLRRVLADLIEDGVLLDEGGKGIKVGISLVLKLNLDVLDGRDKLSRASEQGQTVRAEGQIVRDEGQFDLGEGQNVPPYKEEPLREPLREPLKEPLGAAPPPADDVTLAVAAFNEGATHCPKWTACQVVTDARRRVIAARLKQVGLRGWRKAVELAVESQFLGGPIPRSGNHVSWRMTITWFAKAENFTKIAEGAYPPASSGGAPAGPDSVRAGLGDFLAE